MAPSDEPNAVDVHGTPTDPAPAGDCVTVNVVEHAEAIGALKAWVEHESRGPGPLPPMYANLLTALGSPPDTAQRRSSQSLVYDFTDPDNWTSEVVNHDA